VGHYHLVSSRHLGTLSLGGCGPIALFRLGLSGHDTSVVDHLDELGEMISTPEKQNG
jgi:hypothetical protein